MMVEKYKLPQAILDDRQNPWWFEHPQIWGTSLMNAASRGSKSSALFVISG